MASRLPTPCAWRRPGPHLPRDMKKGMRNRPSNTRCRSAGRLGPSKGRDPHTRTYSTTPRLCRRRTRSAPVPRHQSPPPCAPVPHPSPPPCAPASPPDLLQPHTPMRTPSPPPHAPDSPPDPPAPRMSHVPPRLLPRCPAGGLRTPSPRRPPGLRMGGFHTTWTEVLLSCRNSQTQNLRGKETGDEVVAETARSRFQRLVQESTDPWQAGTPLTQSTLTAPHPQAPSHWARSWPSPASLMSMLSSSSRFSVFRSRWTMLWLWQYSTADRICQNFFRASLSLRCPLEVK